MSVEARISGGPLVALCAAADVGSDMPLRIVLNDEAYAVSNIGGLFYVTQDRCVRGPGLPLRSWTVWIVDGRLFIDPTERRRGLLA